MIAKKKITGIILAGGKSSRMGRDKGFIQYNDEPFVMHSIKALHPIVADILIVTNNSSYDVFGLTRINDIIENAGPLSGVYSGLKSSRTDYNLILSCDIPLIKTAILEKITSEIDDKYDSIPLISNGKLMPLIAFYNKRCEHIFQKLLQNGERRMSKALQNCSIKTIELASELTNYTANINTPSELKIIKNET